MSAAKGLEDIGACVFDAYGTLFDFATAVGRCRDELGDKADSLSELWRAKQLQYTWLRSLMGEYDNFWHVTGAALDFAMGTLDLEDDALRSRLMELYLRLDTFPEVRGMLDDLNKAGMKTAILSNGSLSMLTSAVQSADLEDVLDDVISVDDVGVFKPHPDVYQMAVDRLAVPAPRICFMSSNSWDGNGAAAFGFKVVWVNRYGQKPEGLPGAPVAETTTLADLPALLGL